MNEKQTREQLIDKQLKSVGWLKSYIKEEVNSVRSDFRRKDYILSKGLKDDSGHFYKKQGFKELKEREKGTTQLYLDLVGHIKLSA